MSSVTVTGEGTSVEVVLLPPEENPYGEDWSYSYTHPMTGEQTDCPGQGWADPPEDDSHERLMRLVRRIDAAWDSDSTPEFLALLAGQGVEKVTIEGWERGA